jgi:hypothetical protein
VIFDPAATLAEFCLPGGALVIRVRLRLGAVALGLLVVVTEFGFALYNVAAVHEWNEPRGLGTLGVSLTASFYRPAALLGLATVIGGVALHRATSSRLGWRWHAAVLAPVAVFLVLYRPAVSHLDHRVFQVVDAGLPWTGLLLWRMNALALALQIALYVVAASYVTATGLAALLRKPKLQRAATIPSSVTGNRAP